MKTLIAYFSRSGSNYVSGSIVNLPIGNTEIAAKKIAALTEGELFEIKAVYAYPENYDACTREAQHELQSHARPQLASDIPNVSDYDLIYIGYPNWWGTAPMALFTFLEGADFTNKIIMPFCTHEGSGMGHSEADIKKACPKAKVIKGLAIRGSDVNKADAVIREWIR